MESDNLSCEQVSSALTSAGIGNQAVRPQNGRLFPLTANSDHEIPVRDPVRPHTFVSPSADSRRTDVSYWRNYVHEVLVNR